jgi:hypothetical protein
LAGFEVITGVLADVLPRARQPLKYLNHYLSPNLLGRAQRVVKLFE